MNILIHEDYTFSLIMYQVYYDLVVDSGVAKAKPSKPMTNSLNAECDDEGIVQHLKPTFRLKLQQRKELIRYFKNNQYPKALEKRMIAKSLGLSTRYVQGWFRRERRKEWNKQTSSKSPSCKSRKCTYKYYNS